jgi:hypothetical protein
LPAGLLPVRSISGVAGDRFGRKLRTVIPIATPSTVTSNCTANAIIKPVASVTNTGGPAIAPEISEFISGNQKISETS